MKIIVIVPFDLARGEGGRAIVGPETKIACDRAIELAKEDPTSLIVCTAGYAGGKWNHAWMALVIGEYVVKHISNNRFIAARAVKFNTWGEMEELSRLCIREHWDNIEITLAVKWWHAPRAQFLCWYWFKSSHIKIKSQVSKCPSNVSRKTIAREFLVAWPKNICRVVLDFIGF